MKTSNKLSQIAFIITREFRAISTSYAVLMVLMGGIFVYGLLYNYMYAPNIVTKAPVAVVDNSHSSLSRQYIRWLSATPQVEIYAQAMDYHEAQEWMKQGKVQGILYLPHNFEDRVFQGEEAVFSLYATTDAFLYFEALQEAGLITVEQRERVGAIYRIIVGLTPEGEKYLKGTPLKQGSVAFVAMRGANEKVGKVISKEYVGENKGYAHYTVVLTNITPFGKILENFKEGDIVIENETMELIKDKEGKWKPYTVLDYMAK